MVPPCSHRVSRVRRYSGYCSPTWSFVYGILTLFDVPSHVLRLDLIDTKCSPNPKVIADSGLASSAFATTHRISVDFFSSPYLDVSVRAVPLIYLFIQYMIHELHSCGLLHSDISGSMCACHSPELFAAYRVLHRLLMPRHPPCALISLNSLFAELCLVLKNHFLEEFYFFRRSLKLYFTHFSKFYLF